jgi:hypothetical protein
MPAIDVVNLSTHEKNTKTDLAIAFVGWFSEFVISSTRTDTIQPLVTLGMSSTPSTVSLPIIRES